LAEDDGPVEAVGEGEPSAEEEAHHDEDGHREDRHEDERRDELPAPVIHVPERDLGGDDEEEDGEPELSENGAEPPVRAKRRRGTRGGRGRKRKPAAVEAGSENGSGAATAEADEPGEPSHEHHEPEPEPETTRNDDAPGEWEYTPMSEWGDLDADDR
jgi:hypothetical protein